MTTRPTLQPRLVVHGADDAIEFYRKALGAELAVRYTGPDGHVVHAELTVLGASFTLKDEDDVDPSPSTLGKAGVLLQLNVPDADVVGRAFEAAGGTVVFAIDDQEYGERGGRLADPFGHQWMISQPTEELSPDDVQRRLDAAANG